MSTRTSGLVIVLCLMLGFAGGRASAQIQRITQNGTWWSTVADDSKADVVIGMLDAYDSGWVQGTLTEDMRIEAALTQSDVRIKNLIYEKSSNGDYLSLTYKRPQFSKVFGTYVSLINDFYLRHAPDKATVGDVLTCIEDDLLPSELKVCQDLLR